ncbi:MAG: hypothetical protein MJ219_03040 [Mycoplasmoidaceae bacterium]|nr:hypothetical protein [Mycoplasmoidaceae bacterium]
MIWGKYKFIDYVLNRRAVSNPNSNEASANKAVSVLVLNAIKDVQFGIKDISIRRQTVGDYDYPLISYEINYRIQYDVYYETTYEQDVGVMTGKIKVHDLPYSFDNTLAESGDPSLWAFGPARNIIMYSEAPIQ